MPFLSFDTVIVLKMDEPAVIPEALLKTSQLLFEPQKVSLQSTAEPLLLKTSDEVTPN